MNNDLFTVDAFSEVPFKGNPAAVVLLHAHEEISDAVLQAIAGELNLSETAFVRPIAGGDTSGEYSLRWFTPTNEVPLCGHATLACAHALFNHPLRGALLPRMLRFSTLSGELTVECLSDGDLCMVLPLNTPAVCRQLAYACLASSHSCSHFRSHLLRNSELFATTRFPSDAMYPLQILTNCFHCFWWPHRCCRVAFHHR
jgi:predicted PhzF superfamily epimerase YddE/YHI9